MVPMTSEMVEKAQFSVQNREKNGRFQKAKFEKYGKELQGAEIQNKLRYFINRKE